MSRLDLRVPTALPESLAPDSFFTTDPYVASKSIVEYRPVVDKTYVVGEDSNIEFVLTGQNHFLDLGAMYVEGDLSVYVQNVGSGTLPQNVALPTGGVHALFRSIALLEESSSILDEVVNYNVFYGAISNLLHSRSYIATYSNIWGDDLQAEYVREKGMKPVKMLALPLTSTTLPAIVSSGAVQGVMQYTYSAADMEIVKRSVKVGDCLMYWEQITGNAENTTSFMRLGVVTSMSSSQLFIRVQGAANAAHVILQGYNLGPTMNGIGSYATSASVAGATLPGVGMSARSVFGNSRAAEQSFRFKPYLPILMNVSKLWDLRHSHNCRLRLTLTPTAFECVMGVTPCIAGTKSYTIRLSNLRVVAPIIEPVAEVLMAWDERFNSESGIVDHWTGVYSTATVDNGAASVTSLIPARLASVQAALTIMRPQFFFNSTGENLDFNNASENNGQSWSCDRFGDAPSTNIIDYQYNVGVYRYPLRAPMKVDSIGLGNLAYNLQCLGKNRLREGDLRFESSDVRKIHPTTEELAAGLSLGHGVTNQARKCYLTADFAKDGFLTGANLRDADLMLTITRSATHAGGCLQYHFLFYDVVRRNQAGDSGSRRYF